MNNELALQQSTKGLRELALFAGAGGGILGGKLLGWRTVCAVERNSYARDVLVARQNDGCLAPFPVWDDVSTFDGRPWRGRVDVISGGFPCQDISAAGKGGGITGERSGLWKEMARIIGEVLPRYVLVENSPVLTSRGLGAVLGDLASMGFDARWGVLGAVDAGAPHQRDRIWIMAHAGCAHRNGGENIKNTPDRKAPRWHKTTNHAQRCSEMEHAHLPGRPLTEEMHAGEGESGKGERSGGSPGGPGWWESEPNVGRMASRISARVDRLRCLGNAQVPAVVRLAWHTLQIPP